MQKLFITGIALLTVFITQAQNDYLNAQAEEDKKIYSGGEVYKIETYAHDFKSDKPQNIILMIADGMGVAHLHAGLIANAGSMFIENFKYMGLTKTSSADNYITDSAAAGTALSTGQKTTNGAIGVDPENRPLQTILEQAEQNDLATGLVSTSSITHATPASFIAHEESRNNYEAIAADFLDTDIDVFIGGGYKHFTEREDGRNLAEKLKEKGYEVERDLSDIQKIRKGKLAGFTAFEHNGRLEERGNMLPVATETAIEILDRNQKKGLFKQRGFFLMVEGSQVDWGGHAGDTQYIVEDMLDFDRAVGKALDFAANDGKTLVIVASDHETGGMAILEGNYEEGKVKGEYTTGGHTGLMVPIFAYGPGAEKFIGIMDNTDVNKKMRKLLFEN